MSDPGPIERLQKRRAQLLAVHDGLRDLDEKGVAAGRPREFRTEINQLARELDELDRTLVQVDMTQAMREETESRERARSAEESSSFWLRRFMLSLQIGNGGGFLAATAIIHQIDGGQIWLAATLAWGPAFYFGCGTVAAGVLPLLMAGHSAAQTYPNLQWLAHLGTLGATVVASAMFILGVGSVIVEIDQIMQQGPTMQSEAPAPAPSPAPAPPAGDQSGTPAGAAPPKASGQ